MSDSDEWQRTDELVLNQRNVFQVRGQLLYGASQRGFAESGNLLRDRTVRAALSARSVGTVATRLYSWDGKACTAGLSVSSGVLTSPSRFTTAHHAVWPPVVRDPSQCSIDISFESAMDLEGVVSPESFLEYDSLSDPSLRWEASLLPFRCEGVIDEESPLTANRLFALGLDDWAGLDGMEARNALRQHWKFTNIYSAFDTKIMRGRDVAVLEACKKATIAVPDEGSEFFLRSGPLDLRFPGVLFDINPPYEGDSTMLLQARRDLEQPPPLYLEHANQWPLYGRTLGGMSIDRVVPLVSNPGFPSVLAESRVDACTAEPKAAQATYDDLVTTSLDAAAGSSGGAVNMPLRFEPSVDIQSNLMRQIGVQHGVSPDLAEYNHAWWGPGPVDVESFAYTLGTQGWSEVVDYEVPKDFNTSITTLAEKDAYVSGNPGIIYASTFDKVPCVEWDSSGACVGWSTPNDTDIFLLEVAEESPFRALVDRKLAHETDELTPPAPGGGVPVHVSCDRRWEKAPGVALGFMGTSLLADLSSKAQSVAGLKVVCAPYSKRPYFMNWGAVFTIGRGWHSLRERFDTPLLTDYVGSIRPLSEALVSLFERRGDIGDLPIVQPISMKLCPPNYLLTGVRYSIRKAALEGETSEFEVVFGFRSLLCTRSPGILDDQIHVGASLKWDGVMKDTVVVDLFSDVVYPLCGDGEFSIEQRIGDPTKDTELVDSTCGEGMMVSGYTYLETNAGLQRFNVACTQIPPHG